MSLPPPPQFLNSDPHVLRRIGPEQFLELPNSDPNVLRPISRRILPNFTDVPNSDSDVSRPEPIRRSTTLHNTHDSKPPAKLSTDAFSRISKRDSGAGGAEYPSTKGGMKRRHNKTSKKKRRLSRKKIKTSIKKRRLSRKKRKS